MLIFKSESRAYARGATFPSNASTTKRSRLAWMLLYAVVAIHLVALLSYGVGRGQNLHWELPSWLYGSRRKPDDADQYLLGIGKADITGPVVEIQMMGYADPKQLGSGLRQRLYARAFIIGDTQSTQRFVYVVLDTQSGDTAIRFGILEGIAELGDYGQHNVAITGTHSHSGPGAWLNYLLPQITSKGFDKQSYEAIVNGTVLAVRRAHENLQPGRLTVGHTKVHGASVNRSLFAYLANPEAERQQYNMTQEEDGSVDKTMTLLKFQRTSDSKNIGVLTWFATHGTSMMGNNTLISGDNKGVAASLFEKFAVRLPNAASDFVAGFSQSSMGDVSPNILGAWCEDGSGEQCSFKDSTCADGKSQHCHARGPYFREKDNGAMSCFEIGRRQYVAAKELYEQLDRGDVGQPVHGETVSSFHVFHNMSGFRFSLPNGSEVSTCSAALGYSFAAGTTDGPGAFDFTQHRSNSSNTSPVWSVVSGFLKKAGPEQVACHSSKPILLNVGEVSEPYPWTPNIVDIQAFRVGQLFIIVSPGEATTMAGRRWKQAVTDGAKDLLEQEDHTGEPVVVLGAPANSYTHYITTEEEYSIQRYEGASTLYGPWTLSAYINRTVHFLPFLSQNATKSPPQGPTPPDNRGRSLSFIGGVVRDGAPLFRRFGDVLVDVGAVFLPGETVKATFVGANPRNNLRLENTYAAVEQFAGEEHDAEWKVIRDDSDWDLVFSWRRTGGVLGLSEVDITWYTQAETASPGIYRLHYYGDAKSLTGAVTAFDGVSGSFRILGDTGSQG